MQTADDLISAFKMYWDDMNRCRQAQAYWSLLHVTVCLPDICAALQSDDGETTKSRYASWCDQYLPDSLLTGDERYRMRCKVLHQGRAATEQPSSRYSGFSFAEPASDGRTDHRRVEGKTLILDVGEFAQEAQAGVGEWIRHIESNPGSTEETNIARNLGSLVRVRRFPLPTGSTAAPGVTISRSS